MKKIMNNDNYARTGLFPVILSFIMPVFLNMVMLIVKRKADIFSY